MASEAFWNIEFEKSDKELEDDEETLSRLIEQRRNLDKRINFLTGKLSISCGNVYAKKEGDVWRVLINPYSKKRAFTVIDSAKNKKEVLRYLTALVNDINELRKQMAEPVFKADKEK